MFDRSESPLSSDSSSFSDYGVQFWLNVSVFLRVVIYIFNGEYAVDEEDLFHRREKTDLET
jgi:hypothetical protein